MEKLINLLFLSMKKIQHANSAPRQSKILKYLVEKILRKKLKGDVKIVKICIHGFPVVIRNMPQIEGKPFPTNFWLVCPLLNQQVSQMEAEGWITQFEEDLKRNFAFFQEMQYSHALEKMLRKIFIKKGEISPNIYKSLIGSGVGGIKSIYGVKCLHSHLASFLGGLKNPIGERIWEKLHRKECIQIHPKCAKLKKIIANFK
jgi:hypothetical protein